MTPTPIHVGWISQETDYEMEIYAQEVYREGLSGSEGKKTVQLEKLNYNIVVIVNLSQSSRTSSVAWMAL